MAEKKKAATVFSQQNYFLDIETMGLERGVGTREISLFDMDKNIIHEFILKPSMVIREATGDKYTRLPIYDREIRANDKVVTKKVEPRTWAEVLRRGLEDTLRRPVARDEVSAAFHEHSPIIEKMLNLGDGKSLDTLDTPVPKIERIQELRNYAAGILHGPSPVINIEHTQVGQVLGRGGFFDRMFFNLSTYMNPDEIARGVSPPSAPPGGSTLWIYNANFESRQVGAYLEAERAALGNMPHYSFKERLETYGSSNDPFYVTGKNVNEAIVEARLKEDPRLIYRAYAANTPKTGQIAVRDALHVTQALHKFMSAATGENLELGPGFGSGNSIQVVWDTINASFSQDPEVDAIAGEFTPSPKEQTVLESLYKSTSAAFREEAHHASEDDVLTKVILNFTDTLSSTYMKLEDKGADSLTEEERAHIKIGERYAKVRSLLGGYIKQKGVDDRLETATKAFAERGYTTESVGMDIVKEEQFELDSSEPTGRRVVQFRRTKPKREKITSPEELFKVVAHAYDTSVDYVRERFLQTSKYKTVEEYTEDLATIHTQVLDSEAQNPEAYHYRESSPEGKEVSEAAERASRERANRPSPSQTFVDDQGKTTLPPRGPASSPSPPVEKVKPGPSPQKEGESEEDYLNRRTQEAATAFNERVDEKRDEEERKQGSIEAREREIREEKAAEALRVKKVASAKKRLKEAQSHIEESRAKSAFGEGLRQKLVKPKRPLELLAKAGRLWGAFAAGTAVLGLGLTVLGADKNTNDTRSRSVITYDYEQYMEKMSDGIVEDPMLEGFQEQGANNANRKRYSDFGSPYRGPIASGAVFYDQELMDERQKWIRSQYMYRHFDPVDGLFGVYGAFHRAVKGNRYYFTSEGRSVEKGEFGVTKDNLKAIDLKRTPYSLEVEDADTVKLHKTGLAAGLRGLAGLGDADTFTFRLAGLDAPETYHGEQSYHAPQPHAYEAMDALNRMLASSKELELVYDPSQETYGRRLGILIGDGKSINEQLVREGQVAFLPYGKERDSFVSWESYGSQEQTAMQGSLGAHGREWQRAYDSFREYGGSTITYNTLTKKGKIAESATLMDLVTIMESNEKRGYTTMESEVVLQDMASRFKRGGADKIRPNFFKLGVNTMNTSLQSNLLSAAGSTDIRGEQPIQRVNGRGNYSEKASGSIDMYGTSTSHWSHPDKKAFNIYGAERKRQEMKNSMALSQRYALDNLFNSHVQHYQFGG